MATSYSCASVAARTMSEQVIVAAEGRVDAANAPELMARIEAALDEGPQRLIVDLAQASYVSSSGIRVLLIAHRRQQAASRTLALANTPQRILRVLQMAGFDQVFDLIDAAGDAVLNMDTILSVSGIKGPLAWLLLRPWALWIGLALLLALLYGICYIISWRRCLRRAGRQLGAVHALSESLLGSHLDEGQICLLIHDQVTALVPSPTFVLQLAKGEGYVPCLLVIDGALCEPGDYPLGAGAFDWLRRTLHPLLVNDMRRDTLITPLDVGQPVRSGLYVPIVAEGQLIGVISLQSPHKRAFSKRDIESLSLIAAQSALGLHTAQRYRAQRDRSAQLEMISEVSRKVAAILDLRTLFADTVRLIHETFGYYHVGLYSADAEKETIRLEACAGPVMHRHVLEAAWGKGLIGHTVQGGTSLLVNDVREDRRYRREVGLQDTRAELVIPLKVEERILGALDLQSDQIGSFTRDDANVLGILADQVAVAIEDSRLYQAQQEQAWISTALLQVAEGLAQHSTPEGIVETVVRLTQLLTGVDRCLIVLWAREGEAANSVTGLGYSEVQRAALADVTTLAEPGPLMRRILAGERVHTTAKPFHEALGSDATGDDEDSGELCAFPLWSEGEVIGVLLVEDSASGRLVGPRQAILQGIANQATLAIQTAQLHASQREEAWVTTALLQVANVVGNTTYDLDETLATVVRLGPMLVGVRWCVLLLWDESQGRFSGGTSHGLNENTTRGLRDAALYPDDAPLLGQMVTRDGPLSLAAEQVNRDSLGTLLGGLGEMTILPLRTHGRFVGALLAGHERAGVAISGRRMNILAGIANQTAMAIETAQLYQQTVQQQRLAHEIDLARSIQQSFMPECCPLIPGWQLGVEWRAARGVGGDFYDFIHLADGRLGLVIADVSDKGVGAALYMALSRTVMRTVALNTNSPAVALQRANHILLEDSRSGMFVTLFYGILDLQSGELIYARAGHNPPLWVRGDGADGHSGEIVELDPPGIVLGVLSPVFFEERTLILAPGDNLLLYTDGVTEAINMDEEEYGVDRLRRTLGDSRGLDADDQVDYIDRQVSSFAGARPQFDDFTLMIVKREVASEG